MATVHPEHDAGAKRRLDARSAHAAAIVQRLGPETIDWLDSFLADYVFDGEPLDRVMVKARELAGLPRRRPAGARDDD